jgi:4-hydroxy-2-oxoheptanedioate aldolase
MGNPLKDKLRRDEVALVVNPDHPSPSLTELVAGLGVDGIFIDCEHGMAGIERVQEMCRAARAAGVPPLVRPETDAPWLITRYLDAGAAGVIVPHVDTPEMARRLVETVRYARHRDHADKLVVAMIESLEAVANLDGILEVEGVDVFFVGPGDLSQSMGMAGQMHHPDVQAKVREVAGRVRGAGKVPGTLVVHDTAAMFAAAGCRFLYEHANNFLAAGARAFRSRLSLNPG